MWTSRRVFPSKGQITIPKSVRDALSLSEGDQVVFRLIEGERAILARTPDLLELAGSVPTPAEARGSRGRRFGSAPGRRRRAVDARRRLQRPHSSLTGDPPASSPAARCPTAVRDVG